MAIKRKAEIAGIIENARLEIEKLVTLASEEQEKYDDASESKQSRMDEDEDSSWLRDNIGELEDAQDALSSIFDGLS